MRTIFRAVLGLIFCTTLLGPPSANAQANMNALLLKVLKADNTKTYPVLVKGNVSVVKQFVESHQGQFKYNCGDISSVKLKGTCLQELAKNKSVGRIEYYERNFRALDDTAIIKNNILKIHNGVSPLTQAYDGKGVTFGLVDTGIDFTHPDFKDSLGHTRVMWLWDQTQPIAVNTPMPYNYGQEWDSSGINAGNCIHQDFEDMGHGTKVSGVAVGGGNTGYVYKGLAPKTDIVVAALNFNSTGPVVLDGINYVVQKCASLNQPFVLNLSIGDYYGSHDGLDLQAQAIDALFHNIPGRCVVAAAGNAGNAPFHLQYTMSSDTNFTFIRNTYANQSQFLLYADTNTFKLSKYTIGVYDSTSFSYKGNIGFRDISSCLGTMINDTIFNGSGQRIGIIQTAADIVGDSYEMLVNIMQDSLGYYWTLENTGAGKFDSWNFDFVYSGYPVVPKIAYYKKPDTLQTICTSFQCSNDVITVANYTERTGFICVTQSFTVMPGPYDTLAYDCSRGPTRDNRLKPDIAATGNNVIPPGNLILCKLVADSFPTSNGIISADTMHMKFDGTSSASPTVAGFAALYLQKNPTATNLQIKNAITACAKQDYFTGNNLPNVDWGYGKLDGYNAILCGTSGYQSSMVNTSPLSVYPNPTTQQVNFSFKNPADVTLKIYSAIGQEVRAIRSAEKTISLQTQNFPQGIYLYKVFRDEALINEGKFVKE